MTTPTMDARYLYNVFSEWPLAVQLPALNADGTGIVRLYAAYDDDYPKNRGIGGSHAYYRTRITVDCTEVFLADDIGVPMGKCVGGVDTLKSFQEAIHAAALFASAYRGSGHGDVCNDHPNALEHTAVLDQLAYMMDEGAIRYVRALEPTI